MSAVDTIGLLLECVALVLVLASGTAAAALFVTTVARARSAALRADIAFLAAIAPAAVALGAVATALTAGDHCTAHAHHPHLCVVHFAGLRPSIAVLGAIALAAFGFRAGAFVARQTRLARSVVRLEALGARTGGASFPLMRLPGAPRVCHAVGTWRPRVLVSAALVDRLSPRSWAAVLAHEEMHLRRRDPLALILVEAALLVVPPPLSGALARAFGDAAEGACDEGAARVVGDGIAVAEGLIDAARIVGPATGAWGASAVASGALEGRIRALLDGAFVDCPGAVVAAPWPARGFMAAAAGLALLAAAVVLAKDGVHHALETLLFYVG